MTSILVERASPQLIAPPDACDTHVHIFEPERLAASARTPKPEAAPLADYLVVRECLGLSRSVLVQPPYFLFDNSAVLEAAARLGESARTVVVIEPDTPDSTLHDLATRGVCGVRFQLLRQGGLTWADLEPMAARIAPFGWHVQLQFDGRDLPERAALLSRLPCQIVLDHLAKFLEPVSPEHAAFKTLLALIERGKTYVKLSAPYESSKTAPPDYADVGTLAKILVDTVSDRLLWGSNWPHYSTPLERRSTDTQLLDLLGLWAPNAVAQQKILTDNPARLYGFL